MTAVTEELAAGHPAPMPVGRSIYGVRVLERPAVNAILRAAVVVVIVAQLAFYLVVLRPDLAQPWRIGQDASNYAAAGQRLNDGHPLYELGAGDRPVPFLPPPSAQVPILSPPLLGVAWRPLALLGDVGMVAWWLAGAVALAGTAVWMTLHGSRRRLALIYGIAFFLAETTWSGNVNAFIICLVIGAWTATSRGHSSTAGALIAVAGAVKLAPAYLVWWFVVRRDWPAVRAFGVTLAVLAAVSLVGAGLENHAAFLQVMRETATTGATPWSVAGFLRNSGVPLEIASLATFAWTAGAGFAVFLLRHRPNLSFAAAVLMVLYSSPVVLYGHLGLLLAAGAPYPAAGRGERAPRSAPARARPRTVSS